MRKTLFKLFFLFFMVAQLYSRLNAQIITTVAGGGSSLAEGIPATTASISYTAGIAVDIHGNLYIGDGNNNRVRKVDAVTGIITTIAGTGTAGYNGDGISATVAQLNGPAWVAFDSAGNLYIGEANGYRIRKVDAVTDIISTYAGNGIMGYSSDGGLADTTRISDGIFAFDPFGNLYIGDGPRIRKIAPTGIITTVAGNGTPGSTGDGGPATLATVHGELGICTDIAGNIYFNDNAKYTVRKINVSTGIISTVAGTSGIGSPYSGDGLLATSSQINPFGIAIDSAGDLYISDYGNSRIEKVDISGIIHTITGNGTYGLGGDGGLATAGIINRPENVILDACGNVYISDFGNRRVRKITYNTYPPPVITISASTGDNICAGISATYTSTVTGSSTFAYKWYVNGILASATGSTYTYIPANGDSVRCVFTGTGTATCSGTATVSSNTIHMVVTPLTVPAISITGITVAPIGSLVTVTATVTNAGSTYNIKWFNNGVLFNTTTVPTVTYTKAAGTDNITARVVSTSVGCYDSTTSSVHTVTVPIEGVNTVIVPALHIYPNPVRDVIHIDGVTSLSLGEGRGEAYRLLSIIGSVMLQGNLKEGSNSIPIQSLPAGMYIVEVTNKEGEKLIRKIIKQ